LFLLFGFAVGLAELFGWSPRSELAVGRYYLVAAAMKLLDAEEQL